MSINFIHIEKKVYQPSSELPEIVRIPAQTFLTLDTILPLDDRNKIDHNMQLLQRISERAKDILVSLDPELDYSVFPLEIIEYPENQEIKSTEARQNFCWKIRIRQPEFLTPDIIQTAISQEQDYGTVKPVMETGTECTCVQILQDEKSASEINQVLKIDHLISHKKLLKAGPIQKIILPGTDFNRKMILRQPVYQQI